MDVTLSQIHHPHPRTSPNFYLGQSLLVANPERDFVTMADTDYNAEEAAGMAITLSIFCCPAREGIYSKGP